MALNLSANQFNREFHPHRLCNWEVPRQQTFEYPKARTGHTRFIANDRGHLLAGEPRSNKSPWGHFVSTWQMPKRITKQTAEEIRTLKKTVEKKLKKSEFDKKIEPATKIPDNISKYFEESDEDDPCAHLPKKPPEEEPVKDLSYVPGDLTEPKHRPDSYQLLRPKKTLTLDDIRKSDMTEQSKRVRKELINPFACVYRNFELAKRCAKENLEHHPLPDTVPDRMYRKLQLGRKTEPGLGLEDIPQATGVAWKGYGIAGPTQCTKLRVYRPKTSIPNKMSLDDFRPDSFDLKWRFIKRKDVTPIELAICWDLIPENPSDEPKRTTHIDGSNGSAAPAVFTMIKSPKAQELEQERPKTSLPLVTEHRIQSNSRPKFCDGIHGCGTNSENSTEIDPNNNLGRFSTSTNSLKNAPLLKQAKEILPLHKSSPNLSSINSAEVQFVKNYKKKSCRSCIACNKKPLDKPNRNVKSEYKQAFKAGTVANSKSSDDSIGSDNSLMKLRVPKQKDPYTKRNYDISSLHPPFSVWKGYSYQSYPEHWRLASVYQHSYKPVKNRKRSLLANVYQ